MGCGCPCRAGRVGRSADDRSGSARGPRPGREGPGCPPAPGPRPVPRPPRGAGHRRGRGPRWPVRPACGSRARRAPSRGGSWGRTGRASAVRGSAGDRADAGSGTCGRPCGHDRDRDGVSPRAATKLPKLPEACYGPARRATQKCRREHGAHRPARHGRGSRSGRFEGPQPRCHSGPRSLPSSRGRGARPGSGDDDPAHGSSGPVKRNPGPDHRACGPGSSSRAAPGACSTRPEEADGRRRSARSWRAEPQARAGGTTTRTSRGTARASTATGPRAARS